MGRAAVGLVVAVCAGRGAGWTQTARMYTTADYAQAEKFLDYSVDPLVYHTVKDPHWLADGRFWYRDYGPDGVTFMLVDPAKRTKAAAFDQAKLAAGLNAAGRTAPFDPRYLPIDDFILEDRDRVVSLSIGSRLLRCDLRGNANCKIAGEVLPDTFDVSPDGKRLAAPGVPNCGARSRIWRLKL